MNKAYLILAESNIKENGYYILVGGKTEEETKEIIVALNELLDYVINHSPWIQYSNEEEIAEDIAYFNVMIKPNNITVNKDLIDMLEDCKNLGINWEFTIKEITFK